MKWETERQNGAKSNWIIYKSIFGADDAKVVSQLCFVYEKKKNCCLIYCCIDYYRFRG